MISKGKGGKVEAEQFKELKQSIDGIRNDYTPLKGEVTSLRENISLIGKKVENLEGKAISMDKDVSILKYGVAILIGIGFIKSCDGYNQQYAQQHYQQPPAQTYIINTSDKTEERLKALENAYKQFGEAIKQMNKDKGQ